MSEVNGTVQKYARRAGRASKRAEAQITAPTDDQAQSMTAASQSLVGVWGTVISESSGLQEQVQRMNSSFGRLAGTIGDSLVPAFRLVADGIVFAVDTFEAMPGPVQDLVAISFALVSGLVMVTTAVTTVASAAATAASAFSGVAAVLGSLLGPILVLIAVVAILYVAWKNNLFGIQDKTKQVFNWLKGFLAGTVAFVTSLWQKFTTLLPQLWKTAGDVLRAGIEAAFAAIKTIVVGYLTFTLTFWKTVLGLLVTATRTTFTLAKKVVATALAAITGVVTAGLQTLKQLWTAALSTVTQFVAAAKERVADLAAEIAGTFTDLAKSALTWAKDLLTQFLAGIDAKMQAFTEKVSQLEQKVMDAIGGLVDSAKRWGKDVIDEFISGIDAKIASFQRKIDDLKNTVQDAISFDRVKNDRMAQRWGSDLVDHFARGMSRESGRLKSALPSQQPSSFGLQPTSSVGGRTTVNVTVEAGAVQMRGGSTARVNAEKTAEGVADEFAQRFGRRS